MQKKNIFKLRAPEPLEHCKVLYKYRNFLKLSNFELSWVVFLAALVLPTFAVFYTQKVLSEIFLLSTSVECIWLKLMKNKKIQEE